MAPLENERKAKSSAYKNYALPINHLRIFRGLTMKATCSFLFVVLLLLLVLAACDSGPPPDMNNPGQLIFLGYKDKYTSCARCHGKEGKGGWNKPSIRDAIAKHGRAKVRQFILQGKGTGDDAMPALQGYLTPEEVEQVLDYITTWGKADSLLVHGDSSHIEKIKN